MRKTLALFLVFTALALMGMGCAKQQPPVMEPTAQEFFDAGLAAFKQENYSYAASQFEQAVMKSPSMTEAHYYLGLSYWKMNMRDKAQKSFVDALNLNPSHLPARESLGILLYNMGLYQDAKRNLEAARNLNSINSQVYLALGKIYVMESRCPEAIEVFQKGLMVDSSNLAIKSELDQAKRLCGKSGGPAAPKVIHEKTFRGGGKALNPADF